MITSSISFSDLTQDEMRCNNDENWIFDDAPNFPVDQGTVLTGRTCMTGYALEGDTSITCLLDSYYKYNQKPLCSESCFVSS